MTTKILDTKIIEIGGQTAEIVLQEQIFGINHKRLIIHGHLLADKKDTTERFSLIEERLRKLEEKQ